MKLQFWSLAAIVLFFTALPAHIEAQRRPGKEKEESRALVSTQQVILRNALGVNSDGREFGPARYQGGIVYVTSREKAGPRDPNTGETFFELYYAELDADGMPLRPEPFSVALNSPLNENAVTFDRKGDKIFFTRNNMKNGVTRADSKGTVRMKIYEADRGEFDWENVRELPFNSDEYSCIHPTLSPDGTKLFFSSDMPEGGLGGYDIWFVLRQDDGSWSSPINLGPKVNTMNNEVFPFIHESGILFFSSDGYRSKGGFDIYRIDISGNKWSPVEALGEPFNSPADDISFYLEPEGRRGFFASNREGGLGGDDLYGFELLQGLQGVRAPERQTTVFTVRDAVKGNTVMGANIRVFKQGPDGNKVNRELYDVQVLPSEANKDSFQLRYVLKDEKNLGAPKAITGRLGEAPLELEAGQGYLLLVSRPGYETRQFAYTPRSGAPPSPQEIQLTPNECMTLTGRVLVEQNGQPLPDATIRIINECTGELTILQSKLNGSFEYCLSSGCEFTIQGDRTGFQSFRTQVSTVKIRGSRSLSVEMPLRPKLNTGPEGLLREGMVIVLDNILYDFNQTTIRTTGARSLEGLALLMERYPSMEIELGAHTDARGPADYNLKLSLKRAESARNFLLQRGIAPHRVRAFGYGESRLRNHCVDGVNCTEEEHQFNRRIEIKITRIQESVPADLRGFLQDTQELQSKGK